MRLWVEPLIPMLDGKRLCDLHRTCCNLRGLGWGRRNKSINFLYEDEYAQEALALYHWRVLIEMQKRKYKPDKAWLDGAYCGKRRICRNINLDEVDVIIKRPSGIIFPYEYYLNDFEALHARTNDFNYNVDRWGAYESYSLFGNGKTEEVVFRNQILQFWK